MRFVCIYRPGTPERSTPPSAAEVAAMGKLIGEMQRAGVLLAAEGCLPSSHGAKVRADASGYCVTDGPFTETKELIAGFCMLQVKSTAEAIEWGKRFLAVAGHGESEIRQLHDRPAA